MIIKNNYLSNKKIHRDAEGCKHCIFLGSYKEHDFYYCPCHIWSTSRIRMIRRVFNYDYGFIFIEPFSNLMTHDMLNGECVSDGYSSYGYLLAIKKSIEMGLIDKCYVDESLFNKCTCIF